MKSPRSPKSSHPWQPLSDPFPTPQSQPPEFLEPELESRLPSVPDETFPVPRRQGTDDLKPTLPVILPTAPDGLILLLLLTDLGFIGLHVIHTYTPFLKLWLFSVEADLGYAEVYQYIKLFWLSLWLTWKFYWSRTSTYAAWAMTFGCLLVDDALQIRERLGLWLAPFCPLDTVGGLRPQDFGEVFAAALLALGVFTILGVSYRQASSRDRHFSRQLIVGLLALAALGVGLDFFHTMIWHPIVQPLLGIVEDGGEMFSVSVLTWIVLRHPVQVGTVQRG